MEPFEELQAVWRSQPLPVDASLGTLAADLRQYATRARRRNMFKTGATVVLGVWLLWFCLKYSHSAAAMLGALWMAVSSLTVLVVYWRSQLSLSRFFAEPSIAFVRNATAILPRQHAVFRRQFVIFGVALAAGVNLILAGMLARSSPMLRAAAHAGATAFYCLAFALGLWVRDRRFNRECKPLIDRLAAVRVALEERS